MYTVSPRAACLAGAVLAGRALSGAVLTGAVLTGTEAGAATIGRAARPSASRPSNRVRFRRVARGVGRAGTGGTVACASLQVAPLGLDC
ncbi:pentapeptide repeat-containing protein [Deinococcus sp.]|uniref:pentapeptide repeat-containing protein n=1 Tax=Deinococcus sp. TaxID=47478 RepID=UPI00345B6428